MAYLSEFQSKLYDLLKENMSVSIFDETPKNSKMPYVVIEDITVIPLTDKNSSGFEAIVRIDVWSDYRGNKEANDLITSIMTILMSNTLELPISQYKQVHIDISGGGEIVKETDGLTRSGSLAVRYIFY